MVNIKRITFVVFFTIFLMTNISIAGDCDRGYYQCISECDNEVYDYSSGEYRYNTDFEDDCEDACSRGRRYCEDEDPDEQCYEFKRACISECPSEVYDNDSGEYLSNTDADSVCEEACKEGENACG